jgi:predicted DsbA family dithiol-disulfide isomerase
MDDAMLVEVWSDVVCPWCYLGKRRLESAIAAFGEPVEVVWRSFELDPSAPRARAGTAAEHLAAKYGMTHEEVEASWARLTALAAAEGLEYHLDRTRGGNSFDAHRLVHLAGRHGKQDDAVERLFRAYFTESAATGEPSTLERIGAELELPADGVADLLGGDAFAEGVRADETRAHQLGINGVPFFAIDGRYGVSGAQSSELLLEALRAAAA